MNSSTAYICVGILVFDELKIVNFLHQVPVLKRYPARLSVLSLTCIFGLIQFVAIAIFTEEDLSRWKVSSGGELFTILYAVSTSNLLI
jgi:hypothetical protein